MIVVGVDHFLIQKVGPSTPCLYTLSGSRGREWKDRGDGVEDGDREFF